MQLFGSLDGGNKLVVLLCLSRCCPCCLWSPTRQLSSFCGADMQLLLSREGSHVNIHQ